MLLVKMSTHALIMDLKGIPARLVRTDQDALRLSNNQPERTKELNGGRGNGTHSEWTIPYSLMCIDLLTGKDKRGSATRFSKTRVNPGLGVVSRGIASHYGGSAPYFQEEYSAKLAEVRHTLVRNGRPRRKLCEGRWR